MMEFRPPVTLEGRHVRLVPLAADHVEGLLGVAADPEIWTWVRYGSLAERGDLERHVRELLAAQEAGTDLAFAVLLRASEAPIGMTRFLNISRADQSVEVGGTWYGRAYWRTAINTECKFLLLAHAFEHETAHRVQLKTDLGNLRSQRAIERLGAVREGVLREHILLPGGRYRTSVLYSILATEWPQVRAGLEAKLDRPWTAAT